MNEIINLDMKKGLINFLQRKEVLVNNVCQVFLPISIIEEENILMGYTNTNGYTKISLFENIDIDLCFHIFSELIKNIKLAREYLFFPGEYVLSNETIYYNLSDGTIKIAYSPLRPEIGEKKQLLYVLNQLKYICNEDTKPYVDRLYQYISFSRPNDSMIINIMSELKSEFDIISK